MKRIVITIILMLPAQLFFAQKNIEGIWLTPGNRSAIKIYKTGKYYFGKIIREKNPYDKNGNPNKDIHNPDPELRNKLLTGLVIMKNVIFDTVSGTGKGKIYNPENGNTYKINLEIIDKNTLEVRGYIGISLIGKTSVWKRKK